MAYDSRVIADKFLELAEAENNTLTIMQVLKLVYIAHGWFLGLYHRPLIKDEVQAWQYGPVIPTLYNKIRHFKTRPVLRPIKGTPNVELDEQSDDMVRQVYQLYGKMNGVTLSRITHASGTPWTRVYEPGTFGLVIPNDIIEDHYTTLAAAEA